MKITIEIAQDNKDWDLHREINIELFSNVLKKIIQRYHSFNSIKTIELSILLTNDARITLLNKDFLGKEKATNVLSFPDLDMDFRQILEFKPDSDYIYMGDIAFAFETIATEAVSKKISFQQHFTHLLVHSILHLLGYDHKHDQDAEIMESIEIDVLKQFLIPSPY